MDFSITTNSADATIEYGRKIGSQLKGGEVIALVGPLGSGKTHLIKGIVKGLEAQGSANEVTSPTFVLVNEYTGRLDVFHIDAYRLDSIAQFEQIGFDDYCYPGSVVLIEWADKIESALKGISCIKIELAHPLDIARSGELVEPISPTSRSIRITNAPDYIRF
jgi:tRNA threonylcarbamoyladenosine biosynthesis protein TsaE